MSNTLDKNHPFRSSVNHQPESLEREASRRVDEKLPERIQEDKESLISSFFKAFLKLTPRNRLIVLAVFGGSISYSYLLAYDAVFGDPVSSAGPIHSPIAFASETNIDVDRVEERPSWVARTFCKGVKRSFLCD